MGSSRGRAATRYGSLASRRRADRDARGLGRIYDLILNRMGKLKVKVREVCQALLSIVAAAMRPLHLRELLVFINAHWMGSGRVKFSYQLRDIQDMTKDCGPILSIRDDIVCFVHQSAKDHIMEAEPRRLFPIPHQHYKMFEASLDAMSSVLTYDMYNLKDPRLHIDEVSLRNVNSDPLNSLSYCCAFWVEHLVKGIEHFEDSRNLHSFLTEKFLCWIESLTLMRGYILYALPAIQKLKRTIESYFESGAELRLRSTKEQMEHLRQFLDDACRFVIHSTTWVIHWPLQLYFLAIEYEPEDSIIKKTFSQIVRDGFGHLPTAFLLSHNRQSSLRRRAVTFSSQQRDLIHHHHFTISPNWFSPHFENTRPILTSWRMEERCLEHENGIADETQEALYPSMGYFNSVPREGVMTMRDFHSCFAQESIDLNRGSYHGYRLYNEDSYTSPG